MEAESLELESLVGITVSFQPNPYQPVLILVTADRFPGSFMWKESRIASALHRLIRSSRAYEAGWSIIHNLLQTSRNKQICSLAASKTK
jgi:hypothetical protein